MHKSGQIQYRLEDEEGGASVKLVCFPEEKGKRLELTTSTEGDTVHVFFEDPDAKDAQQLGHIALPGYFLTEQQAKYSSKHSKYTLRLGRRDASSAVNALAEDDVDDTFHDARSSTGSSQTGDQDVGGSDQQQQQQQQAMKEGAGGEGESAAAKKKKKKKKKKKGGSGGGAQGVDGEGGEGESEGEEDGQEGKPQAPQRAQHAQHAQQDGHAEEGEQAAAGGGGPGGGLSKSQKKRQKQKGKAAGPAAEEPEEQQQQQQEQEQEQAQQQEQASADAAADEHDPRVKQRRAAREAEQRLSGTAGPKSIHTPPPGPAQVASAAAAATAPTAPSSKGVPIAPVMVDMEADFAEEPLGASHIGSPAPELGPNSMLHGPTIRHSMAKNDMKGEDKWLEAPHNVWELPQSQASTHFAAFGVFDGHGGKQSATYTSKNLLPAVAKRLDRVLAQPPAIPAMEGVSEEDARVWAAQDALIERAPKALHAGFVELNEECKRRFKQSGTTATLVMIAGWEVIVASVGDSCAFMDTGSEIIQISGQHRVIDNSPERERIKVAGGDIEQSEVDGKAVGQLRVWPGGLAMTRSIGDYEAGEPVIGDPEIRQISIPAAGARIIIASDGLWDALHPRTVIQKVRRMNTGQATNIAIHTALEKAGVQDDITIIVIDLVPSAADRDRLMERRRTAQAHITAERERQAAAEAAAAAQAAAAAAAAEANAAAQGVVQSDTYKELSELKVDVSELASLGASEAVDGEEGWTTVKGHASSRPEDASLNAASGGGDAAVAEAQGGWDGAADGGSGGRGGRQGRGRGQGGQRGGSGRQGSRGAQQQQPQFGTTDTFLQPHYQQQHQQQYSQPHPDPQYMHQQHHTSPPHQQQQQQQQQQHTQPLSCQQLEQQYLQQATQQNASGGGGFGGGMSGGSSEFTQANGGGGGGGGKRGGMGRRGGGGGRGKGGGRDAGAGVAMPAGLSFGDFHDGSLASGPPSGAAPLENSGGDGNHTSGGSQGKAPSGGGGPARGRGRGGRGGGRGRGGGGRVSEP